MSAEGDLVPKCRVADCDGYVDCFLAYARVGEVEVAATAEGCCCVGFWAGDIVHLPFLPLRCDLFGYPADGCSVCIVSIVRIPALTELTFHDDGTRYNSSAAIWSSIEANVAIICSSLPPLRPLIVRLLPSSLRTSSASEQERPVRPSLFFVGNDNLHFGDGGAGYEASVTASGRTNVQQRGSSLEPSLEMSREQSHEGQSQKEDGMGSGTTGETNSGIQVVKELRLGSDLRRAKEGV